MRRLRFHKQAARDIDEILRYTLENFGASKHDQYKELITQALADIARDPDCRDSRRWPDMDPDLRTFPISRKGKPARHLLAYRIAKGGEVEVVRVLHDAMDLRQQLPEDTELAE